MLDHSLPRFALATAAVWLTLVAATVLPSRAWRWALGGLAFLWITAGLSVAADLWWSGDRGAGVLVADDVAVRKGDGEGFALQFEEPLHQGVEFEVVERRGGWLHIRLPDEKTGWIDADAAALVVP